MKGDKRWSTKRICRFIKGTSQRRRGWEHLPVGASTGGRGGSWLRACIAREGSKGEEKVGVLNLEERLVLSGAEELKGEGEGDGRLKSVAQDTYQAWFSLSPSHAGSIPPGSVMI